MPQHETTAKDLLLAPYESYEATLDKSGVLTATEERPAPEGTYVYIVELDGGRTFGRVRGASAVVYIGRGTDDRVEQLYSGDHSAWRALAALYGAIVDRDGVAVRVCVEMTSTPELRECELLTEVQRHHGELPPCNLRGEGWLSDWLLRTVAEASIQDHRRWNKSSTYLAPTTKAKATVLDLRKGGRTSEHLEGAVVWEWPEEGDGKLHLVKWKGPEHRDDELCSLLGDDWKGYRIVRSLPLGDPDRGGMTKGVTELFDRVHEDSSACHPIKRLERWLSP